MHSELESGWFCAWEYGADRGSQKTEREKIILRARDPQKTSTVSVDGKKL